MPQVIFKLNLEKDARNYYDCANSIPHWGQDFTKCLNHEMLERLRGTKWEDVNQELIQTLKKSYDQDLPKFEKSIKQLEIEWAKIEKEFFKRLEKITKHKIYTDKFICYFTTIGRCPYDQKENWFMANIFSDYQKNIPIIMHEMIHLQTHYYFEEELLNNLSKTKFNDLKEALTVLLNAEFKDLMRLEDKGYPAHQELRKFIEQEWNKNKNFEELLIKCVEKIKKV